MNRQEALDWCVDNLAEWSPFAISLPIGMGVKSLIDKSVFYGSHEPNAEITKQDWLWEKKSKDQPYMPQVGEECEVHNDEGLSVAYGKEIIGKGVIIEALFTVAGGSIPMASVSYYGDCYCFRQSMLRPIQTQEEKDREFHRSVISAILEQNDVEINKACMNDIIDHIIKNTK